MIRALVVAESTFTVTARIPGASTALMKPGWPGINSLSQDTMAPASTVRRVTAPTTARSGTAPSTTAISTSTGPCQSRHSSRSSLRRTPWGMSRLATSTEGYTAGGSGGGGGSAGISATGAGAGAAATAGGSSSPPMMRSVPSNSHAPTAATAATITGTGRTP